MKKHACRPRDNASSSNRDAPQHSSYQASRDKYRAMSGTWERGLDPETAAMDDGEPAMQAEGRGVRGRGGTAVMRGSANGSMAAYQRQRPMDNGGGGGRAAAGARGRDFGSAVPIRRVNNGTGGMRGERGAVRGAMRGDRDAARNGGAQGDFDRFRNGGDYGRAAGGRGGPRGRDDRGGGGSGEVGGSEPDAKRPRVTSTIVIAGGEDTGEDTGEMDRWSADPAPTATQEEEATTDALETAAAAVEPEDAPDNDDDDDNVDYEPDVEPETASAEPAEDAASASTAGKEKSATAATGGGEQPMDEDHDGGGEENGEVPGRRPAGKIVVVSGGGPRGRAARAGGVAGSDGGMRGSLASRLGPPMGRPVMVKSGSGDGDGYVPPAERPMPEPSRPELHQAYKDGDTKKRNRRCELFFCSPSDNYCACFNETVPQHDDASDTYISTLGR